MWPAGWVSDESRKGVAQKRTTVKRTRGHESSPKSQEESDAPQDTGSKGRG